MQQSDCVELDERQLDIVRRAVPDGARNVQRINYLTPAQEGMLFHYRLQRPGGLHVLSILLELPSLERAEATVTAVQRAVNRYDSLRSAVLWEQLSSPVQVVHCEATVPTDRVILPRGANSMKQLQELIPLQRRKLDLQQAPLLRVLIASAEGQNKCYAMLMVHHLVCDHISWRILLSDVAAHLSGCPANELVCQERHDAIAEARHWTEAEEARVYFNRVMSDVDESTAPFGLLEILEHGAGMVQARGMIESDLSKRLRAQARRFGVGPARLFHAAWGLVVVHTSGRADVVFGTVLNVRSEATCARQFGMFVNTLPLRLRPSGMTAIELIDQTQCRLAELLRFKDASLPMAQRCSCVAGSAPLFTSLLNYRHRQSRSSSELFAEAGIRVLIEEEALTNYPLSIVIDDLGDDFSLIAQADHRIDPYRVTEYLHNATRSLLHALEHDSRTPTLQLAVLGQREKHLLVRRLNETLQLYSRDKLIHELFEEQVELAANESAVEYLGQALTYSELNTKANRLAWSLKREGVGPDCVVGLCVERGFEMVVGMLAILKAGGAFLPLDPKQPVARLQAMLAEVAPRVLLTQTGLVPGLPKQGYRTIFLDRDRASIESQCSNNSSSRTTRLCVRNLAYVIYTSGSTGVPKGVMAEHGSVLNLVQWGHEVFKTFRPRRCSALASLAFDASVLEIWPALCFGATLVLSPSEITNDPALLLEWWQRQRVDVSFLPTPIAELAFSRETNHAQLQLLLVGGDRLHCHPPANVSFRVQDNFGPTETTVVATCAVVGGPNTALHIGRPISNTQVYVLGPGLQPSPMEAPGEIYIGGAGVCRGYINKPESTAERFIPDPFSDTAASRLYRTGDIGRWRADGTLEFLGRTDRQLKIRGYRVEPGEIECQLLTCPGVREAIVVGGDDRLVAYFIAEAIAPGKEHLRSCLEERLPAYMVPAAYVQLESFPLAPSGKIDRRRLPSPRDDDFCRDLHEAPCGRKEIILASLWRELLRVDRVGRRDNFLALGGHSLLAMRLLERMRREELFTSVQVILQASSLMELAKQTEEIGEILL